MPRNPKQRRCSGCGAQLEPGSATCPLCGRDGSSPRSVAADEDVGDYQDRVRKLRAELRKLRGDGAEAV